MTSAGGFPDWFTPLLDVVAQAQRLGRFSPPSDREPRRSAVLILFAERPAGLSQPSIWRGPAGPAGPTESARRPEPTASAEGLPGGPEVLLTERAGTLRSHAGQVAFPGGALDPGEDPVAAALREGQEETGLDPAGVQVAGTLPDLYLMVSDFVVTPVLAWWRVPSPVRPVNPGEVARVVRVPVAELADPGNRFRVAHPSGFIGPAFTASGLFVWGFTAGLLDRLLHLAGWERPWDEDRVRPLPSSPDEGRPTESPPAGTTNITDPLTAATVVPPSTEHPNQEHRR